MTGISMSPSGYLTPIKGQGTLPDSKLLPPTPTVAHSGRAPPLPLPGTPAASSTPAPRPNFSRVISETVEVRTEGYDDSSSHYNRIPNLDDSFADSGINKIKPLSFTPPPASKTGQKSPRRTKSPKPSKAKIKLKTPHSPKSPRPPARPKSPAKSRSPKPSAANTDTNDSTSRLKELLVTAEGGTDKTEIKSQMLNSSREDADWNFEEMQCLSDFEDDSGLTIDIEAGKEQEALEKKRMRVESYMDTINEVVRLSSETMEAQDSQEGQIPPSGDIFLQSPKSTPKGIKGNREKLKLEREARIELTIDSVIAGMGGQSPDDTEYTPEEIPEALVKEEIVEEPIPEIPQPKDIYDFDDLDAPIAKPRAVETVKTESAKKKTKVKTKDKKKKDSKGKEKSAKKNKPDKSEILSEKETSEVKDLLKQKLELKIVPVDMQTPPKVPKVSSAEPDVPEKSPPPVMEKPAIQPLRITVSLVTHSFSITYTIDQLEQLKQKLSCQNVHLFL